MLINSNLLKFAECLNRLSVPETIAPTAIDGLFLIHASTQTVAVPTLYEPSVCIIANGTKHVMLGRETLRYQAGQCLVASMDLPVKGSVVGATKENPYLCVMMTIKPEILFELMPLVPVGQDVSKSPSLGLSVHEAEEDLIDCVIKLCRILEKPEGIPVLAPLAIREMHYRLLSGPQGEALRQIATAGANAQKISKVIGYVKKNFSKPIGIAHLAKMAGMSESSLHAHFKAATSMSPVQFQKNLRLLEARRRLVVHGTDASNTAYEVGYESISQFSREYTRMFGLPPIKDAQRVKSQSATWYGSLV